MLPRLPGFKAACFTRRLVGFHHTFAPVGSYTTSNKVESVVWHEGTSGRKCEDIASAVMMALEKDRDVKTVLYYMDYCAGQNKIYALYTAIIDKVNSANIQADTITLKYLQAGHTFMSADSFHARTEKEMKRRVNVYDFDDFVECIKTAGADVIVPSYGDFRCFVGEDSKAKLAKPGRPKLADVSVAQFRRGSRMVHYKVDHTDPEFREFDYLLSKHKLNTLPAGRTKPRGISEDKKSGIIQNLCTLMPVTRTAFWDNIAVGSENDLVESRL